MFSFCVFCVMWDDVGYRVCVCCVCCVCVLCVMWDDVGEGSTKLARAHTHKHRGVGVGVERGSVSHVGSLAYTSDLLAAV